MKLDFLNWLCLFWCYNDDNDDDDCENETGFFQSKDCAEVDDSSEDDNDTSLSLVDDKGKESDIDDDSPGISCKPKKGKEEFREICLSLAQSRASSHQQ
eukprot:gene1359-1500_t